jgi:hypothetical protein
MVRRPNEVSIPSAWVTARRQERCRGKAGCQSRTISRKARSSIPVSSLQVKHKCAKKKTYSLARKNSWFSSQISSIRRFHSW